MPNRSVARSLIILVTGILAGQFIQRAADSERGSSRTSEDANRERKESAKTENRERPTAEEHRAAEIRYWNRSVVAVWITVGVATVAAIFSFKAFEETRRQADAADANNRPWLKIEKIEFGKFKISEKIIEIDVKFYFQNIGHEPANNVKLKIVGPMELSGIAQKPDAVRLCSDDESGEVVSYENYFPGDGSKYIPGVVFKSLPQRGLYAVDTDFIGCLIYNDSTGKRHLTSSVFSFLLDGRPADFTQHITADSSKSKLTSTGLEPNVYAD